VKRTVIPILLCAMQSMAQNQAALTLVGPPTLRPGTTVAVNVMLSNPHPELAAIQWSAALPTGFTASAWTCTAGAASTMAAKDLYCNPASTTCLTVGVNANLYAAGVVAIYSLTVPSTAPPGPVAIPLSGLSGATLGGADAPLTSGVPYNPVVLASTDLNGDGKTDVQDLQIVIQRILAAGADITVRGAQLIANVIRGAVG
jgi:hypothetical protein